MKPAIIPPAKQGAKHARYHGRMATLLLNLYRVPDDEAADVRQLLDQHQIRWHETQPSPWGISHGAIWVDDEADLPRARRVFAAYQAERSERVRAEFAAARSAGTAPTLWSQVRANPGYMLLCLLAVLFALAIVILPVWLLL